MRALHSAERKGTLAPQGGKKLGSCGRRVISLLLCLCMTIPMLFSLGEFSPLSEEPTKQVNATANAVNRVADKNTMDDYQNRLLSKTAGSRYAGRVWTDKSVFAYTADKSNVIELDMETDGYKGNVAYNADFAHVFSALASSQLENEAVTSPLDLVILLDMSGSMGADIQLDDELEGTIPINQLNGNRGTNKCIIVTPGQNAWTSIWWDVFAATYSADAKGYRVTQVYRENTGAVNMSVPSNGILVAIHNPSVNAKDRMKVDVGDILIPGAGITFNESNGTVSNVTSNASFGIYKPHKDLNERITHSRIYSVLESINSAIEQLMEMNETNRVTVVGYGATAATILPLGHYEKIDGKNYLSVSDFTGYYNGEGAKDKDFSGSAAYTVNGHAKCTIDKYGDKANQNVDTKVRNAFWNNGFSGVTPIGFMTDLQAGIYQGFNELYESLQNVDDVTYTYRSTVTGEERTVPRIPVAFVMTDGGSNYALRNGTATGNEWFGVPVLDKTDWGSGWNYTNANYTKYRAEGTAGGDAVILDILLTASYMKSKIQKKYTELLNTKGLLGSGETATFEIHTVSVDTPTAAWQIPRVYAGLDPKDFFNANPQKVGEIDPSSWSNRTSVTSAFSHFETWRDNSTSVSITFNDSDYNSTKTSINAKFNQLPGTDYVKKADVISNILYNDSFADIGASDLAETFRNLIKRFDVPVFAPISGDNDAGVGDSITYQDPLGEYMEIKNSSITTTPHHVGDDSVGASGAQTYDMALLVFGEMHGLVRAGVYDYHWNNKWMELNASETIIPDKTPFPMGWYKGEPKKGQGKLADEYIETDADGSSTYPKEDPDTHKKYNNAQEARNDGWVYRFNFQTLLSFVPIAGTPEDNLPGNLSEQEKNTVYTCYRFAGSKDDRNALHMNPIYGTDADIPKTILDKWDGYKETGNYPVGDDDYAKEPGVYRLSDIRVWLEDTGDYVDTDGAITPNTGYDRALYLNVPTAAVPTQLATITISNDEVLSYQTNLATDKGINYGAESLPDADKKEYERLSYQSTPLRLFYAVGLEENLILRDTDGNQLGVDFTKISPEYIQAHGVVNEATGEQQNYVWFISNYYSNTTYGDYVTETTSRTRGDPTVSFSPSEDNRYYVFQKPLPLYAHAYRVQDDGSLKPVDNTAGTGWGADKSGNGSTTWENSTDVTGGGSWSGGEFIGTYENEDAFKTAYTHKITIADKTYITDSNGNTYLYQTDGIVFFKDDLLDHVTSNPDGGYTSESISFSSNDYFFILLEYYLPTEGTGTNLQGDEVPYSTKARKVQRVLARKGSEFGSGFVSNEIDNGDMLCWTDMNGHVTDAFEYLSKSETGDPSRGEPTWEKLTKTRDDLKEYLTGTYGIQAEDTVPNPDYDPTKGESADNKKEINVLDYLADYWLAIRDNEQVKAALTAADENGNGACDEAEFNAYFQFAVATRPGGIRPGDMSNNIQIKSENATNTSNSYYLPTISENSGTDDNVIINNYLGNNGYMEIANQMLHVTKQLVPPTGFELTNEAKNEKFNYQIFVQGVSGTRSAILTEYNEYGKTWERQLAYIDVLTDNSDLVLDNSSNRALFVKETFTGSTGDTTTAKQVIAEVDADGNTVYYEANEDGTLTIKDDGSVGNRRIDLEEEPLYYLYLPSNGTGDTAQHTRRLYQNPNYDGTADGYADTGFKNNGTTTFYEEGQRPEGDTGIAPDSGNNTSYRKTDDPENRPAGTITYWAQDAELIPMQEVLDAEATNDVLSGEPAAYALEVVSSGQWVHMPHVAGSPTSHVNLTYDTFVVRKPAGETSMTAFESPFKTRTQYMTMDLVFGKNANPNDGSKDPTGNMTTDDVYDPIIPSVDRSDLFGSISLADIATHTAEFTLKHNEGLLLSGLDNRVTYRFTEKLTDEQMKKGYTLKQINHIQQVGSDTVYMPGVQEIPVYKNGDGALTWAIGSDGQKNPNATEDFEPFAHTNAILWESYATMAAGASGNHHQPENPINADDPAKNPSCNDAGDKANLGVIGCDLAQTDGTTRHYFYYGGQLIDPHYEGEAATFLSNTSSRYVLSPTAHFGLTDEEVSGTNPENGYYEYSGVYSVYGNTGWFEEQAHYINTVSPEMLVLTKQIVDMGGAVVENPPEKEFTFTVTFTDATAQAIKKSGGLYYWKGKKDFSGGMTWTDKTTAKTYSMPSSAPNLDKYQDYILPVGSEGEKDKTYLAPLELEEGKNDYTIKLKANEAVVIYGLTVDTGYTIKETPDERYPAVGGDTHTATDEGYFTQSGTVVHDLSEANSMFPNATPNRVDFYNRLPNGMLTIGKKILDSDADTVTKEFTFEVTLTSLPDDVSPTVTKYDKNGAKVDDFAVPEWESNGEGGKVITFTLQHKETVVIEGIPLDTKYTIKETQRDGYNLQHVADNKEDLPVDGETYLELTNGGIEGTVTAEKSQAYLLFVNGKAVAPPFTGGIGANQIVLGGVLLIGLSVALFLYGWRRKHHVI